MDHDKLKRKINNFKHKTLEGDTGGIPKNSKYKSKKQRNMNGPETNLNQMPNLTTFDSRAITETHKLINNIIKGKKKQKVTNKSMRKLNKDDVLPIYKRRAYNKGPIKVGNNTYKQKPLKTQFPSKRQNSWVKEQMNISEDEILNHLSNNQPVKAREMKSGRQPNEFRINKNKGRGRGKTAQGPRNQAKNTLSNQNNVNNKKMTHTLNQKNPIRNSRKNRLQAPEKRAQSMHQGKVKGNEGLKIDSSDLFSEINKFKQEFNELQESDKILSIKKQSRKESKPNPISGKEVAKDINSMIEKAQEKIKATAESMLQAQQADKDLDNKIDILNEYESNKEQVHQEDNNIQNHLQNNNNKGMSRQERIANIVNEIVAQNKDLDLKDEENEEELDIKNQNTLMAFTDKGLEPIKEQVTEEIHTLINGEGNNSQGPDKDYEVEKIFETNQKDNKENKFHSKIEETPIFGEKEEATLFTSFL